MGGLQGVPQPPQLLSVFSWRSQPFVAMSESQSPKPGAHCTNWQNPLAQLASVLAKPQAWLQAPQLCSVVNEVSQPSLGSLLQSSKPGAQLPIVHRRLTQASSDTPGGKLCVLQSSPQLEQFASVPRLQDSA